MNILKKKVPSANKEAGNIIDELGSIIVIAFMFAMVLAYAGIAKLAEMKLGIDNVAKEYLYIMEEEGYLSTDEEESLTNDLVSLGVDEDSLDFSGTDTSQVAYGDQVTLYFTGTFDNPLYDLLSSDKHSYDGEAYELNADGSPVDSNRTMFTIAGLSEKITFTINFSSTAKW